MRKYRIVFQKAFKSQMIYRAATLSSAASTLLSFAIQICLWHALLGTGLQSGTIFTDMVLFEIGSVLAFLVSLVLGVLLMFELTYTFGLLAFRIQRCWFLSWYVSALTTFFGGTAVPLWFYPKALQTVSYVLPFRYVAFEPVNLLLGRTPAGEAWVPILCALAWLLVLGLLDRVMWRSAVQGLTVNGG